MAFGAARAFKALYGCSKSEREGGSTCTAVEVMVIDGREKKQ